MYLSVRGTEEEIHIFKNNSGLILKIKNKFIFTDKK